MKNQNLLCALAFTCMGPALGQWSSDTSMNQLVTGAPSDQNQVKVVAALDGGFWVSWLDGIGSGWDVRVQKYDARGRETLAPGGLLVADRSFSSTQDYGLSVASGGDALLAFRDDRGGGVEITAARVSLDGVLRFGPLGVPLTSGAGFVASPKIAPGVGDGAVVAWTENADVRVQSLDAFGAPLWGTGVTLVPPAGSYVLADMQGFVEDTIVSIVHQTGGFTSPRHLLAQRIDRFGSTLWGATPVTVFDGGSLQIGSFPSFDVMSGGRAVFAWYSSSPALQCFVQRLAADGSELWPHNGVAVATSPGVVRVDPVARIEMASDEVVVAWRQQNGAQSASGIFAQRFDAAGSRLWLDGGTELSPVGASLANAPQVIRGLPQGETLVTWEESPSFGSDRVFGARVDAGGAVVAGPFDVATTASAKARYAADRSVTGTTVLAWSDQRSDGGDIYLQAFDPSGAPGDVDVVSFDTCPGVQNTTGAAAEAFAVGSALSSANDLTLWATGLPRATFAFFLTSQAPGLVPGPGSSAGNLCLGGAIGRFVGPGQIQSSGAAQVVSLRTDLALQPTPTGLVQVLAGERWHYQCWYRDIRVGSNSNFTSAAAIDFQ